MFEKFAETINNAGKAVGEKTKLGTDVVRLTSRSLPRREQLTSFIWRSARPIMTTILTIPAVRL